MNSSKPARSGGRPFPQRQRGSATAEYIIVGLLIAIVLVGNENVIKQLAHAMRDAYASFAYALSASWF